MTAEPADLDALLELATGVACEAGALLLARRDEWVRTARTKLTPTDMVSDADHASERLIRERVRAQRPYDAFLGEEGGAAEGGSGVRWVVDPLDGTTNYLYGLPAFAVSIAVEVMGTVGVGVVFDPSRAELFTAIAGRGARLNGAPITTSGKDDLGTALVATGFGYDADWRGQQGRVVASVLPRVRDIRRSGSAALDLCALACGRVDAFYERGVGWWDIAAGGLIVREAGGVAEAVEGGPLRAGSVLAGPGRLCEALRPVLLEAEAAAGIAPDR